MRGAIGFGVVLSGTMLAAACTAVLGDDFTVGGSDPTSGTGAQGGGNATTSSGTQGGGGTASVSTSVGSGGNGGTGGVGGGEGGSRTDCPTGFADCDNNPADCETPLTSPDNCGACYARCLGGGTCSGGSCTKTTRLAQVPGEGNFVTLFNEYIYWTVENGTAGFVLRLPLVGGRPTLIATMQRAPYGIVANLKGVFWTSSDDNAVTRSDLDGGSQETVTSTSFTPLFVAGDEQEIFWSQREGENLTGGPSSTIGRLDLTSGEVNENFLSAPLSPHGLAVDAQYLYWVDRATLGGSVRRVNRSNRTDSVELATMQHNPYSIVVDDQNVYWTNNAALGSGGLMRTSKVGGEMPTTIATGGYPRDIAIDQANVYWTEQGEARVMKALKTGPGSQPLAREEGSPKGIVVDETHVYWVTESNPSTLYKVVK